MFLMSYIQHEDSYVEYTSAACMSNEDKHTIGKKNVFAYTTQIRNKSHLTTDEDGIILATFIVKACPLTATAEPPSS